MNSTDVALGRGIAYPLRFDEAGTLVTVSGVDNLKARMIRLLSTYPGEDPFLYKNGVPFGVKISKSLFTDFETAKGIVEYEVRLALETWEPAIAVTAIQVVKEVARNPDRLLVHVLVYYRVRATATDENLVVTY